MRDVAVQHETLQTASCHSVALRAPCVSTPSTGVSTPSTDVSTPSTSSGAGRADGVVPRLAEALFGGVAERRGQARVPGEYYLLRRTLGTHVGTLTTQRVRACVRGCAR